MTFSLREVQRNMRLAGAYGLLLVFICVTGMWLTDGLLRQQLVLYAAPLILLGFLGQEQWSDASGWHRVGPLLLLIGALWAISPVTFSFAADWNDHAVLRWQAETIGGVIRHRRVGVLGGLAVLSLASAAGRHLALAYNAGDRVNRNINTAA